MEKIESKLDRIEIGNHLALVALVAVITLGNAFLMVL